MGMQWHQLAVLLSLVLGLKTEFFGLGLGLMCCGLGIGLAVSGLGLALGLELCGLVNSTVRWTICKQSAPCCRQITTLTPHHSIYTGRLLFLTPNQQCQSTA